MVLNRVHSYLNMYVQRKQIHTKQMSTSPFCVIYYVIHMNVNNCVTKGT